MQFGPQISAVFLMTMSLIIAAPSLPAWAGEGEEESSEKPPIVIVGDKVGFVADVHKNPKHEAERGVRFAGVQGNYGQTGNQPAGGVFYESHSRFPAPQWFNNPGKTWVDEADVDISVVGYEDGAELNANGELTFMIRANLRRTSENIKGGLGFMGRANGHLQTDEIDQGSLKADVGMLFYLLYQFDNQVELQGKVYGGMGYGISGEDSSERTFAGLEISLTGEHFGVESEFEFERFGEQKISTRFYAPLPGSNGRVYLSAYHAYVMDPETDHEEHRGGFRAGAAF